MLLGISYYMCRKLLSLLFLFPFASFGLQCLACALLSVVFFFFNCIGDLVAMNGSFLSKKYVEDLHGVCGRFLDWFHTLTRSIFNYQIK